MVAGWFRPPVEFSTLASNTATDLEKYNIRTDAWGLLTIALMLLALYDAVPISNSASAKEGSGAKRSLARLVIMADVFHHVMTGIGAYQHYSLPSHYNTAMAVGVYGCAGFAILGTLVLLTDLNDTSKSTKTA
ncbi:hypothetical protein M8818_003967 [Zalaria obscura]|uniref:Uncharacterized protein n=1 Tax=Zalaria obscura TaxID=2024903 RepID=A0ACC3SHH5_9PEZI